jgi:flagellin
MRIQHNIMAMNAYRNYSNNTSSLSGNLEKLSSGYKINRAGDDAAGLAISEKMRAQISGLDQASSNVKDGISLVKTGEGALQEVQDMLNRMVTLATQSANGTYDNTTDRASLQKEVDQLKSEIDRIADSSNFNGINLLDGTLGQRDVTVSTGIANGVSNIQVIGGGKAGQVKTSTDFKANVSTGGTVTLSVTGVSGVKWEAVGVTGTASTEGGTSATGKIDGTNGGSVTFRAVVNRQNTATLAQDADFYDGMTVTVTVAAAKDGKYVAGDVTATGVANSTNSGLKLQIGDTADTYNQLKVAIQDMHSSTLGLSDVTVGDQDSAATAIDTIKAAINIVSGVRGTLGATQNRLEHTQNNLSVMTENIQDAESTIRDTDVAEEMMAYTKNNILVQSAQAMLAQANTVPQGVLQLLQ